MSPTNWLAPINTWVFICSSNGRALQHEGKGHGFESCEVLKLFFWVYSQLVKLELPLRWSYRKILKMSPGAYIFQWPFLRGLFLEGLIFGGAYVQRQICISKSVGLACSGKELYHFCFVLLCIQEQIPRTSPLGGLYSEGWFNGGFLALRFWGAYILRGLFSEFYGIFS